MPIDLIFGLIFAGLLFLAMLTVVAIVEAALECLPDANVLEIVDPKASRELERIAAQKGSRPYKRFAYDRRSKKAVLVESNKISDELKDEEYMSIDIR